MQFYALTEEWPGESTLFFRALPGCFVSATTTHAAFQASSAVIEQYFRWLKANDLAVVEGNYQPIDVVLAEKLAAEGGRIGPCFAADRRTPNELEVDNALNVSATARALIIEVINDTPAQLVSQAPEVGSWSLIEHLRHVMESDNHYISRLQKQPVEPTLDPALSAEDLAMKMFEDAMDNELTLRELLGRANAPQVVVDGQEWTLAKVLRRQTAHLYEHLLAMVELQKQLIAM